jgi:class 3 adenylate cyclase
MEKGNFEDDEDQNGNGDLGANTKRPNEDIMSHSDSMTIRRIQDFIRYKRNLISSVVADFKPIAASFPDTSIMFADISNFTFWSSLHSPNEVFTLLESLFSEFDKVAMEMEVFHLSTVGDCYIATTGVPYPREDHAIVLAQFSRRCRRKANEVLQKLREQSEITGISQLKIRIGIHSGPVLAGVLRGNNRFDVFGDTMNTASRIESTGEPDRIHLSKDTAELLQKAGNGGC